MDLPVIVAVISGLFALLGGFWGASLARRTEYEKWLRQERSTVFSDFIRQLHAVREKTTNVIYAADLSDQQRDIKVTELFFGLSSQENIVRLYLEPRDRDKFVHLVKELWVLHSPCTGQARRLKRVPEILLEIQLIFEMTIHAKPRWVPSTIALVKGLFTKKG